MNLREKAGRLARLFLSSLLGLVPLRGEDGPARIPPNWIAGATADQKEGWRSGETIPSHEAELIARIYARLLEALEKREALENYTETIPGSKVSFDLVAIAGGTFRMGSPSGESGRNGDEPRWKDVAISDFWMGKHEVTWAEFAPFSMPGKGEGRNMNGSPKHPEKATEWVDWISAPTLVYVPPDRGMGRDEAFPAVGMTQHAANKYCQWLSWQTGHFYRLPTEAEWEYACRAGTTGPFHCPDEDLSDYAVYDPELKRTRYEKVGTKKANPWGLHDMHGNVAEWCLDGYSSTAYGATSDKNPWFRAKQRYPRVVRGGSWYDSEPTYLRSAHRGFSHPDWNLQDPQLPQSIWWLVDADWVGFRVVRPAELPSETDVFAAWNTGAMHYQNKSDVIPEAR